MFFNRAVAAAGRLAQALAIVPPTAILRPLLALLLVGCASAPAPDAETDPIARVMTRVDFASGGYINNRTYDPLIGPLTGVLLSELWRPSVHYRYTVQLESGRLVSLETVNEAKVGECVWVQLPRESSHLAAYALGQASLRVGASCARLPLLDG
jgi:hypothetical protein